LLVQKFRVYQRRLQQTPEHIDKVILATCVLHNFLRDDSVSFPGEEHEPGNVAFSILSHVGGNSTVEAMNARDLFSQYFVSPEGSVEWQRRMTRRGFQLD
jgi:hypothetical protein